MIFFRDIKITAIVKEESFLLFVDFAGLNVNLHIEGLGRAEFGRPTKERRSSRVMCFN